MVSLVSCAGVGPASFSEGTKYFDAGDYDKAVIAYSKAVESNPKKPEYQMRLDYARAKAAVQHKVSGDDLLASGQYSAALLEYDTAASLDPSIETSIDGIQFAQDHLNAENLVKEGEDFFKKRRIKQAKRAAELALQMVPDFKPAVALMAEIDALSPTIIDGVVLEVTSTDPITLNLKKVRIPDAFKILSDLSGINFILDDDIRSTTTTLYLEKASFAQALELLLSMNKLDKKILNPKTIILFPKNKEKQKQFEDQIIQTFYLSNIDAKKAVNLLRTILQLRKVYVHEELNAVVIRDTPSVIKLAEKVLEANDRSSSEVVFDLELIEVSHGNDLRLGPKLSAYQVQAGIKDPNSSSISIGDSVVVENFNNLDILYGLPSLTFDMLKQNGDGEVLASPKIRVKNKEKAKVHIGSREPVVTVTINGDQTSENVQYIDVGVKLDVEPSIQLDNTVVTKLGLEVSNVSERDTTSNGTAVLTISTTNANTSLTLKDGVQTVLGGLIRTSETTSTTTVPVLGDIPLLGKLFTSYSKEKTKREILLSITPHIVKSFSLPQRDVTSLWSGGEDDFKNGPNFGTFAEDYKEGSSERVANAIPASTPRREIDATVIDSLDNSGSEENPVRETTTEPPPGVDEEDSSEIGSTDPPVASEQLQARPAPVAQSSSQVFLLGSKLARMGEPLEVIVVAEEIKDLFSAPMYIKYDDQLLDFVGATELAFMKRAGETVFTYSHMPDKGLAIIGLKLTDKTQSVSGGGGLFKVSFNPKASGFAEITPQNINFRNAQGEQLSVTGRGLTVEIE